MKAMAYRGMLVLSWAMALAGTAEIAARLATGSPAGTGFTGVLVLAACGCVLACRARLRRAVVGQRSRPPR
jgi:hypothetical protein